MTRYTEGFSHFATSMTAPGPSGLSMAGWVAVMALATVVYLRERRQLRARGVDVDALFAKLPPE